MYYSIIVVSKEDDREICQQAISGDSGEFQMISIAKKLLDKFELSVDDVRIKVSQWNGHCYTNVNSDLNVGETK